MGWGALDFRISLTLTNHGFSISAHSYDFCPRLAQLDNIDFTLSHMSRDSVSPVSRILKSMAGLGSLGKSGVLGMVLGS